MLTKEELNKKIQELSFSAVDLNLFLNTHPNDPQALKDYSYVSKSLQQLRQLYNEKYGPFFNFGESPFSGNYWNWVAEDDKWPWEGDMEV
ncbi:spore coat protein CotJB [Mycoplasmatota bacterium]|nr:spore coat protein CotJB [Mycoplasmatota bacterium]